MTTDPLREGLLEFVSDNTQRADFNAEHMRGQWWDGFIMAKREMLGDLRKLLDRTRFAETTPVVEGVRRASVLADTLDDHQPCVVSDGITKCGCNGVDYENPDWRLHVARAQVVALEDEPPTTPPPAPVAGVEVTEEMVERGWRAHQATWPASPEDAMRAALTAALTPEAGE